MAEKREKPQKVKVVLAKEHTHAGQTYKAGAEIEVRPEQAEWLKKLGVIK